MHTLTKATVLHLALDPAPPLKQVVAVTDLLRQAAVSELPLFDRDSMLTGKAADGTAMKAPGHPHAHWLPVTAGRVIAGICLWVPAGLEPEEIHAVLSVRRLGSEHRFGPAPAMTVTGIPGGHPVPAVLAGPASAWESVTPFIPVRSEGRASRQSPEYLAAMVTGELTARGFPAPAEVAVLGGVERGWLLQRPSRPGRILPPVRLRVRFAEPVTGPVAIGRLSHFGLGVLRPA